MERKRAQSYSLLRVVGTVFVVFGHASLMSSRTGMSFLDFGDIRLSGALYEKLRFLFGYAYSFHMPLFFFVSGGVYRLGTKNAGGAPELGVLLRSKAKRLLAPYFTWAALYVVPVRYLLGAYGGADTAARAAASLLYSTGEALHLWFLPALFFAFLLFWLLDRFLSRGHDGWAALAGALLFLCAGGLAEGIPLPLSPLNFLFFLLGCAFEGVREAAERLLVRFRWAALALFALYVYAVFVREHIPFGGAPRCAEALAPYAARTGALLSAAVSVAAWYVPCALLAALPRAAESRALAGLERNCFGIYLLHDPLNHIAMALLLAGLRSGALRGLVSSEGVVLLRTAGIFFLSLFVSALIGRLNARWRKLPALALGLALFLCAGCAAYALLAR